MLNHDSSIVTTLRIENFLRSLKVSAELILKQHLKSKNNIDKLIQNPPTCDSLPGFATALPRTGCKTGRYHSHPDNTRIVTVIPLKSTRLAPG
jgi:hypothetical protein